MTILDRLGRLKFLQTEVNILQQAGLLTHNLGLVYSPLSREIVELGSKNTKREPKDTYPTSISRDDLQTSSFRATPWSNDLRCYRYGTVMDVDDKERWFDYLLRPAELAQLIKRYHVVGDKVVISIFIHLLIAIYLWIKAMFHFLYTKTDEETAIYFASHYFPRLSESYPNQYELYGLISAQCSYILTLRLYIIMRLIKRSVINKNGYKEIEMSQLNGVFAESFRWPLKDWFRLCVLGRRHLNACNRKSDVSIDYMNKVLNDIECHKCRNGSCNGERKNGEKQAHLYSKTWDWNKLLGSTRSGFLSKINPIDFSECYRYHDLRLNNGLHPAYYYPEDNCRIDMWELSWLAIMLIAGTPLSLYLMFNSLVSNLMAELAALSPNGFQSTTMECLQQFPELLTNANHLIRLMDSYFFVWMLHHHSFEQAQIHVDICALLSRIRKLNERLQADLDALQNISAAKPCQAEDGGTNDGCSAIKEALNARLEMNMFLAKIVNDEFMSLQKSTTTFLDLLTIGQGFCVAAALSVMFATESRLVYAVAFTCFMYAIVSMVLSAFLCMAVEIRVSSIVRHGIT